MEIAVGISTYIDEDHLGRIDIIKRSVDSLYNSNPKYKIFYIDDGSKVNDHILYIENKGFEVIKKENNGGGAKSKNFAISHILERLKCDKGILCDDDIEFQEGWIEQYIEAMTKTGLPHFTGYSDCFPKVGISEIEINGYKIKKTTLCGGYLMTFTKDMINKVGYFTPLKHKYGHRHSLLTKKCVKQGIIPCFIDVINPKCDIIKDSMQSVAIGRTIENIKENGAIAGGLIDKFQAFIS